LTPEHEKEIRARDEIAEQQAADRQAIIQKRESLHRLFPEKYAPDVSMFTDGKVEIMFKLSYEQAENLARLMKGHDLYWFSKSRKTYHLRNHNQSSGCPC